jgi:hypothetical protein
MSGITAQQKALYCIALAIKQGHIRNNKEAAKLAEELSEEDLRKLCDAPSRANETPIERSETGRRR